MTHLPSPDIADAPGLKWTPIKVGWIARWRPRSDLVKDGFPVGTLRLWSSTKECPEPDEKTKEYIAERCRSLQADMLAWAHGGVPVLPALYDATWGALVQQYKTDRDSPYHKKEFATREHYDSLCRRIVNDCGSEKIAATDARRLLRLHEGWIKPDKEGGREKIPMGHALIGMMRTITTFGATLLKCQACKDVRSDLKDMRVQAGKPREEALTADQVIAIRAMAHRMGWHSIALAQSMQFDIGSGVRQKDIIGAYVPISENVIVLSDAIYGNEKWIKGLRGEELDENFFLRHVTSKRKKLLPANLLYATMVMEEFRIMAGLRADEKLERHHVPLTGPLVICESTGQPWRTVLFRRRWREIADACGISKKVKNMDSRAGGVTEGFASGADPDDIRKGATHATLSMTARYSRGDEEAIENVMKSRAAHRNKTGTTGS